MVQYCVIQSPWFLLFLSKFSPNLVQCNILCYMNQKSLIQENMYPIIEFKFITMLHIESNASEKPNSKKS